MSLRETLLQGTKAVINSGQFSQAKFDTLYPELDYRICYYLTFLRSDTFRKPETYVDGTPTLFAAWYQECCNTAITIWRLTDSKYILNVINIGPNRRFLVDPLPLGDERQLEFDNSADAIAKAEELVDDPYFNKLYNTPVHGTNKSVYEENCPGVTYIPSEVLNLQLSDVVEHVRPF